jgi:hypothetical protein
MRALTRRHSIWPRSPLLPNLEAQNAQLWISRQIIREYLATLVRPRIGIPVADLANAIRTFESRYQVAEENPQVTAQLLVLLEQTLVIRFTTPIS